MKAIKILLAEDDLDDRLFFYDFLHKRSDLEILPIVENGVEVIKYLESCNSPEALPDVIILDQNMPMQNGMQTLQLLKTNRSFENIPVLIYTTYANDKLIRQGINNGAALVLAKPATEKGYNEIIDALFEVRNK